MNTSLAQVIETSNADVQQHARSLPLWEQDYIQLSKGQFSGVMKSVQHCGIQVFSESMNRGVDQIATPPEDSYVIGIPIKIGGEALWGLQPVEQNSLLTLNKNTELYFRTTNHSEILAVVIPAELFERYADDVECIDISRIIKK